jgi:hypothetical protein
MGRVISIRIIMPVVLGIALMLGFVIKATTQPAVLPSLPIVANDPTWGPICAGPLGAGRCEDVRRYILVQQIAAQLSLQPIGNDALGRLICAGPLGPGPCDDVRFYLATRQYAAQQIPLLVVGQIPGDGPECAGPFGPGPCDAIRIYLANSQIGIPPTQQFDPRRVQMVSNGAGNEGPLCNGPFQHVPCLLAGQIALDRVGGSLPSQISFGLPAVSNVQQLAGECARRTGLDIPAFAGCAGQRIILPQNQQDALDCAVDTRDTQSFAECAAPHLGIGLPAEQRLLARCAMRFGSNIQSFTGCAGAAFQNRDLTDDEQAILACGANANGDVTNFGTCAAPHFLSRNQKAVVDCAVSSDDAVKFAQCAADSAGVKISEDQRILARCAMGSNGNVGDFATCAGGKFLGRTLGPNEQAVLNCASDSGGDTSEFTSCSAQRLLGNKLSPEQKIAIQCAAQSQGDATSMATCAGANMFNLQLNPEQQIAVQCVVSTGGQPYAAAGCMASRWTVRELTKCLSNGIGGDGCFGDTNDLVGRNGWVARTLGQVAGGPNSVFRNPDQLLGGPNSFVRHPDQIWGGDNSFVRNPDQIFGGSNSFVRNPSQIWGGNNSIFNNPAQLLPQPKPLQIASIGGKRICLPWC